MILHSHSDLWDTIWTKQPNTPWHETPKFLGEIFAQFVSAAPLHPPLLDVGCGRGKFLEYVRNMHNLEAYGADFSLSPLKHSVAEWVEADCRMLPFSSNCFGSVTSLLLIEHVPNYEGFIKEAARVLTPGGCLYLLFPNIYSLVTPALFVRRKILGKQEIPYHKPLRLQVIRAKLEALDFLVLSVRFMSIASFRTGLERAVGKFSEIILPKCFKEEIIVVGRKR